MDLMSQLNAHRFSSEEIRARQARRAARASLVYERIGQALGKTAATKWNIFDEQEVGASIGEQHPGAAALLVVRSALGEYNFPSPVDLRYLGMRRESGHGAYGMTDGHVYVQASFSSLSGPKHSVTVPVVVHKGQLLVPSIVVHQGVPRVLTQHTFDDILGLGEFKRAVPDRLNMYAPPGDRREVRRDEPLVRPGMYSVLPRRGAVSAADVKAAVRGYRTADSERDKYEEKKRQYEKAWGKKFEEWTPDHDKHFTSGEPPEKFKSKPRTARGAIRGRVVEGTFSPTVTGRPTGPTGADVPGADGSHLDVAERDREDFLWPGADVRATKEIEVRGFGGQRMVVPKGEKGVVVRDIDGAGKAYYVRWHELGWAATVGKDAIKLAR